MIKVYCVESVQIRSYFWSAFSCIQTEYRKIRTRNNSVFGHFITLLTVCCVIAGEPRFLPFEKRKYANFLATKLSLPGKFFLSFIKCFENCTAVLNCCFCPACFSVLFLDQLKTLGTQMGYQNSWPDRFLVTFG